MRASGIGAGRGGRRSSRRVNPPAPDFAAARPRDLPEWAHTLSRYWSAASPDRRQMAIAHLDDVASAGRVRRDLLTRISLALSTMCVGVLDQLEILLAVCPRTPARGAELRAAALRIRGQLDAFADDGGTT